MLWGWDMYIFVSFVYDAYFTYIFLNTGYSSPTSIGTMPKLT